jgi:hypothetical protein
VKNCPSKAALPAATILPISQVGADVPVLGLGFRVLGFRVWGFRALNPEILNPKTLNPITLKSKI